LAPARKVRADHFQTVASGSIAAQHQSCGFDRFLNDRHLALIKFEVDNLPRLRYCSGEFSLYRLAEKSEASEFLTLFVGDYSAQILNFDDVLADENHVSNFAMPVIHE